MAVCRTPGPRCVGVTMLMADMSEGERNAMRSLYGCLLPEDVELIETLEGVALVRRADARVELVAMSGLPGVLDGNLTPIGLDQLAEWFERRAAELHRFAAIVSLELAVSEIEFGSIDDDDEA